MTEINDHTDAEIARREAQYENGWNDDTDVAWDRWSGLVETMLVEAGITTLQTGLDGDQEVDGFSIDFAYEQFENGEAAGDYARSVIATRREEQIAKVIDRVERCLESPRLRPAEMDVRALVDHIKNQSVGGQA